jgi:hypothetical protein
VAFLAALAIFLMLVVVGILLLTMPDVNRYLRMRRM